MSLKSELKEIHPVLLRLFTPWIKYMVKNKVERTEWPFVRFVDEIYLPAHPSESNTIVKELMKLEEYKEFKEYQLKTPAAGSGK